MTMATLSWKTRRCPSCGLTGPTDAFPLIPAPAAGGDDEPSMALSLAAGAAGVRVSDIRRLLRAGVLEGFEDPLLGERVSTLSLTAWLNARPPGEKSPPRTRPDETRN